MNLEEEILALHSRAQTNRIVDWVGADQSRFDQLFAIFQKNDYLLSQRASWPLYYSAVARPGLIARHFGKLLKKISTPGIHDAVRRNATNIINEIPIPRKYEGRVMTLCFDLLTDPAEKVASKANAISILHKLSSKFPEIRQELLTIIESEWDRASPAYRARARLVLKSRG